MTIRRMLKQGGREYGVEISDEQVDSFLFYLMELEKWNRKINLTAIRGEQDVVVKHFIDSFTYLRGFDPVSGMQLLDMGSGAGFPALPIKIVVPVLKVTMVEAVQKKATFLRHMVRMLRLQDVEVQDTRTDRLTGSHDGRYDVVTARAFADMEIALREGVRFLKPGGLAVLSRGPEERIEDAVVSSLALTSQSRTELVLPFSDNRRALWVFRKDG